MLLINEANGKIDWMTLQIAVTLAALATFSCSHLSTECSMDGNLAIIKRYKPIMANFEAKIIIEKIGDCYYRWDLSILNNKIDLVFF